MGSDLISVSKGSSCTNNSSSGSSSTTSSSSSSSSSRSRSRSRSRSSRRLRQHPVILGLVPHSGSSCTNRCRFGQRFVIVFVPSCPFRPSSVPRATANPPWPHCRRCLYLPLRRPAGFSFSGSTTLLLDRPSPATLDNDNNNRASYAVIVFFLLIVLQANAHHPI